MVESCFSPWMWFVITMGRALPPPLQAFQKCSAQLFNGRNVWHLFPASSCNNTVFTLISNAYKGFTALLIPSLCRTTEGPWNKVSTHHSNKYVDKSYLLITVDCKRWLAKHLLNSYYGARCYVRFLQGPTGSAIPCPTLSIRPHLILPSYCQLLCFSCAGLPVSLT